MNIDLTDISPAVYNRKVTISQILWESFMTNIASIDKIIPVPKHHTMKAYMLHAFLISVQG
jgi:hypothetical protein